MYLWSNCSTVYKVLIFAKQIGANQRSIRPSHYQLFANHFRPQSLNRLEQKFDSSIRPKSPCRGRNPRPMSASTKSRQNRSTNRLPPMRKRWTKRRATFGRLLSKRRQLTTTVRRDRLFLLKMRGLTSTRRSQLTIQTERRLPKVKTWSYLKSNITRALVRKNWWGITYCAF